MYRAKDEGRNTYQFFTAEMQQLALARIGMERDLRYAIERHEFVLNFQPKVELVHDKVVGLEVLIRWHSGKRGVVSPAEFISLAEENGQIVALGEWVLRAACKQYVEWHKAGCAPGSIAVNVSGRQLRSEHFIRMVRDVLESTQMPTSALELELTESFLMENEDQVMRTLNELRALGLHLSVDDFGTGYSSLSYLKRFPISTLKIDKSFVQDIPGDDEDLAIVAAILRMASALKLEVVAEGVETSEQLRILREMGCGIVQGYFFSRPLSVADCTNYLQEHVGKKHLQALS
jgi:EAL domain-containing protein (putative c-di-GMP-specific phosphodiesterase class I)